MTVPEQLNEVGSNNQWWHVLYRKIASQKLSIALFVLLFGNNIFSWSWIRCTIEPTINVSRRDEKLKGSMTISFRNIGGKSGFEDNVILSVIDPNTNKTIAIFGIDSCSVNNSTKDKFSEIELASGIRKCKFYFTQKSDEAINWKEGYNYRLQVIVDYTTTISFFPRSMQIIKTFLFTIDNSSISIFNVTLQKNDNLEKTIELTPLD